MRSRGRLILSERSWLSSTLACSVEISETVRSLLGALSARHPARCRDLALLLLSLEKDPTPPESRELTVPQDSYWSERIWTQGRFEILYRVHVQMRSVQVGHIRP